jgi:DNA-binding response OmpR family regulator/tetratricopeptide (TPR) repeat protein
MSTRILVVEDDRYFAGILRDYLGYVGFDVAEASDGQAGWDGFDKGSPVDLVLTDVLLPRVNGLELAARIKADPRGSKTPVVLMSAVYKDDATVERNLRQSGADGYLVKPFSMPDLKSRLSSLLRGKMPASAHGDVPATTDPELTVVKHRPGEAIPKEGEVKPGFLGPLLLQLRAAQHTGVLQLRDRARWKDIVLLNGHPVWADGGDTQDRLGTMLLEEGVITQDELAQAVQYMKEKKVDFGLALTDNRILSPTDLYRQLRALVMRRVVAGFAWNIGTWTLTSSFPKQTSSFELRPLITVWRGIRAHGDWKAMKEELHAFSDSYVIPGTRWREEQGELRSEEGIGFLLTFVSGQRTVAQLAEMEILDDPDLYRALWLLFKAGLLGFGRRPGDVRQEEPSLPGAPTTLEMRSVGGSLTALGERIIRDWLRLWQSDFFRIFGLTPKPSEADLEKALAADPLGWTPDKLPDDLPGDIRAKAKALYEWVQEARQTLRDPKSRAGYAERLHGGLTGVYRNPMTPERTEAAMFFEMGKGFVQTRDFREAELSFGRACERAPDVAEYVAYRGWAAYRRGGGDDEAAEEALGFLKRSVKMDEHLPIAWYFLGIIHRDRREYDEAVRAFESAVRFDPQFDAAEKALVQARDLAGATR